MKVGATVALLGLMLFVKRPFCRFICPLRAIYAPFNKVAPSFCTAKEDLCVRCGKCTKVCPMDLSRGLPLPDAWGGRRARRSPQA